MSSREETPAAQTPPARKRWLPLLALGVAALLYAGVWRLPSLLQGHTETGKVRLFRVEGGKAVELKQGEGVAARARIRFAVELLRPASVVLVGLNAEGRATLYVPSSGDPPRVGPGTSTLGEQALDGIAGPEVFLAVLCNTTLSPAVILKAGERAAAAAAEPRDVQTLDLGCPEAHFWLRKEALR
jgi:hypothetical protein